MILLSYTSIIITHNNLIHKFYKMVTTHYRLLTYNVDTRDPIGSKKVKAVVNNLLDPIYCGDVISISVGVRVTKMNVQPLCLQIITSNHTRK